MKFNYLWLLILVPIIFLAWYFFSVKQDKPVRMLAYFGPKNVFNDNDTVFHRVPAFSFTNQNNEITDTNTTRNKIYVTEFFFTTCPSICPIMNNNLQLVYKEFENEQDVLILSHTVDPETDSIHVLKEYANKRGVTDKRWLFLTGSKKDLYDVARKGYLLDAEEGNGGPEDFIHTQNFALVDKERRLRGFYDGTDSSEVQRLIREIKLLKKEYAFKKNSDS